MKLIKTFESFAGAEQVVGEIRQVLMSLPGNVASEAKVIKTQGREAIKVQLWLEGVADPASERVGNVDPEELMRLGDIEAELRHFLAYAGDEGWHPYHVWALWYDRKNSRRITMFKSDLYPFNWASTIEEPKSIWKSPEIPVEDALEKIEGLGGIVKLQFYLGRKMGVDTFASHKGSRVPSDERVGDMLLLLNAEYPVKTMQMPDLEGEMKTVKYVLIDDKIYYLNLVTSSLSEIRKKMVADVVTQNPDIDVASLNKAVKIYLMGEQ